jgi:hypothetical protein
MDTVHERVERHDRRINKIKQIEEGILKWQ